MKWGELTTQEFKIEECFLKDFCKTNSLFSLYKMSLVEKSLHLKRRTTALPRRKQAKQYFQVLKLFKTEATDWNSKGRLPRLITQHWNSASRTHYFKFTAHPGLDKQTQFSHPTKTQQIHHQKLGILVLTPFLSLFSGTYLHSIVSEPLWMDGQTHSGRAITLCQL